MNKIIELASDLINEISLSKDDRIEIAKILIDYNKEKEKHKRSYWIVYPCVWECANCHFWIDKYINSDFSFSDTHIKNFKWCPCCGAEMIYTKGSIGKNIENIKER